MLLKQEAYMKYDAVTGVQQTARIVYGKYDSCLLCTEKCLRTQKLKMLPPKVLHSDPSLLCRGKLSDLCLINLDVIKCFSAHDELGTHAGQVLILQSSLSCASV